jgi:hypothetical protein
MTRTGALMTAVVITAFIVGFLLGALGASFSYESGMTKITPASLHYRTPPLCCKAHRRAINCPRAYF